MLRSYFTLALRQLWRNRLYTGLNIVGLAIGLSACWAIYLLVSYELSFDRNLPNSDRLYRVVSRFDFDGQEKGNAGAPKPLANAIRTQVPGVALSVPVKKYWAQTVDVPPVGNGKPMHFDESKNIWHTTPDYFRLVPYTWLVGDPAHALAQPDHVVLTASRAKQYFPHLTPKQTIGQRLTYISFSDTTQAEVAGVVADLGYPTDFSGSEFVAIAGDTTYASTDAWTSVNSDDQLYVQLLPNADPNRVIRQANAISIKSSRALLDKIGVSKNDRQHVLQPLADIHFNTDYQGRTSLKLLYSLMGLALFVLVLAVMNYVNLSTAQAPQRAREIGVRKTLGSSRGALIGQFLGETALVTALALLLAWPLATLALHAFQDMIPEGATDFINVGQLLGFLAALLLTVSLLAGTYPAWLITRVQPARILRSHQLVLVGKTNRLTLRKGLIVFQFVIAQVFMVGAIIIGRQLQYAYTTDMGFNRQAVVLADVPFKYAWNEKSPLYKRHFTLATTFQHLPGVAGVSLGNAPFSNSFSSGDTKSRGRKGQEIAHLMQRKYVDTAWLNLYQIKLLAGRNLHPSDTAREWVINETALKVFDLGTPQQALGKMLEEYGKKYPIVGVVRDFNTQAMTKQIHPAAIMATKENVGTFNIKLASTTPADWPATLSALEAAWKKAYPDDPFKYRFYDEELGRSYSTERNIARIVNLATGVAILISCLGLFGLATLTAFQRTKEIGIRKVLGASVASVVGLLSREFVVLVGVAVLIATPLAGWGMKRWLDNYAYKIDLSWWLFAGAAGLALLVALLTVSFQSIRAAVANPVESLRSD